ncbi:hypothetical protein Ddye_009088 [Dipteronia dyeriana]|uniref:non-specific serine/threonine protein kinase n=1 Tax=Dipteronia dyeriana TaxID=168575 RepID=A0AAE0CLZ2_9ROSI|nr:hypothetical protein Ddye_009088 [Dipteronia dyeriana]
METMRKTLLHVEALQIFYEGAALIEIYEIESSYRAFDEFKGIQVAWNQVKLYDILYRLKQKRVNIRAVKHWFRQILRGLLYLHSLDPTVIHRDFNCDNIFVYGNQGEGKKPDGLYKVKDSEVWQFVEKCLAIMSLRFSARELLNDHFLQIKDAQSELRPLDYCEHDGIGPHIRQHYLEWWIYWGLLIC